MKLWLKVRQIFDIFNHNPFGSRGQVKTLTHATLLHFGWKLLININIFFSFATMGRERKSKLWFMRKLSSTLEKTWHAAFNSTANMKRFILDWWVNLENCYFSSSWKRQNVVYWLHLRFACGFLSLLGIEGVPYFLMFFLCTPHEESFQCKLPFYLLRPYLSWWYLQSGYYSELRISPYLIFVIFFTLAKFLENKIYTEKRQFFALNL